MTGVWNWKGLRLHASPEKDSNFLSAFAFALEFRMGPERHCGSTEPCGLVISLSLKNVVRHFWVVHQVSIVTYAKRAKGIWKPTIRRLSQLTADSSISSTLNNVNLYFMDPNLLCHLFSTAYISISFKSLITPPWLVVDVGSHYEETEAGLRIMDCWTPYHRAVKGLGSIEFWLERLFMP